MTNRQWIGTLGLTSVMVLGHSVAALAEPPMNAAELQTLEQPLESRAPLSQSDLQHLSAFTEGLEAFERQALTDTLEGLSPGYPDSVEHDPSHWEPLPSPSPQFSTSSNR